MIPNIVKSAPYEFDLIVVGGGSGGLSAAKEAALYKKKVAVCDFVTPSVTRGNKWGLGGTCVNVGCIPKKLMHNAALLKEYIHDAEQYGWKIDSKAATVDWNKLVYEVQNHIKSLNFGYRTQLRSAEVNYFNELATFIDPHTIQTKNAKGNVNIRTAEKFLISVGGRPLLPDIPGIENCITSDDIFNLQHPPGKTLVIGASYIALECAGFLKGMGFDTTVAVRSIFLRGFDQQMAELIGENLKEIGVNILRPAIPQYIKKLEDGKFEVGIKINDSIDKHYFDTVLVATGRQAATSSLGLDPLGIKRTNNHKIFVGQNDETSLSNIYAIGDCAEGRPELTPTAILAGKLLSRRLFTDSRNVLDYNYVPTTVFTPIEYGTVGLSEEAAIQKYGEENIEVYHANFQPLEQTISHRLENKCYAKLICNKLDEERIIGFHILVPGAGEITQGFTTAMRLGAKKKDFDSTVHIHPVNAENLLLMNITKRSGESPLRTGC